MLPTSKSLKTTPVIVHPGLSPQVELTILSPKAFAKRHQRLWVVPYYKAANVPSCALHLLSGAPVAFL